MGFDPMSSIPPRTRDEFLSRPEVKQWTFLTNIFAGAFFAAALIYLWMTYSGILGEPVSSEGGFPVWYALLFISLSMVPAMIVMAFVHFSRMKALNSAKAILAQGQQLLIIELAMAESVAIYGLIGVFMGMPKSAQYGLIGFGMFLIVAAFQAVRGRIIDLALVRFVDEEAGRNR